jgi:hypothetical protein
MAGTEQAGCQKGPCERGEAVAEASEGRRRLEMIQAGVDPGVGEIQVVENRYEVRTPPAAVENAVGIMKRYEHRYGFQQRWAFLFC